MEDLELVLLITHYGHRYLKCQVEGAGDNKEFFKKEKESNLAERSGWSFKVK